MMQQHVFQTNMFAFFMNDPYTQSGLEPEVTFGFYDKTKFKGELEWHPVIKRKFWGLRLDDIKVNGKPLNVCKHLQDPNNCIIAADSGTQYNTIPPAVGLAFKKANAPLMSSMVECASESAVGSLTYVIGGKDYTMEANEWVEASQMAFTKKKHHFGLGPKMGNSLVQVESAVDSSPKKMCSSTLYESLLDTDETFLLGEIFMRKFYTVFDRDNDRVAFALSTHF